MELQKLHSFIFVKFLSILIIDCVLHCSFFETREKHDGK